MYWTTYAGEGFAIYGQGVAVDGHVMALGPLLASGPRAMALAPNSAVKRFQYLEGATDVNPTLIPNLRERGWTVEIVEPGHPEYARMVQELTAGEYLGRSHMRLLQKRGENIKQVTVLEEFLHATQDKIPRFDIKHPYPRYEIHVKDFMIRHRRMLGLEDGDVLVLE